MTWAALLCRSSNRPVMARNRPPMTDVGGSAAIYIDLAGAAIAFTLYRISCSHFHLRG